jgi:RND family efflux transporter MFP subunit
MTNLVRRMSPVVLPLFVAVALAACSKGGAEGPPGGAGGPQGGPPVSVAPVTQRSVQEFDEYSARIEATELVDVRSRVAGTLDKVHLREGQKVAKGDLLFTIDPRPFAAEVARLQALLNTAQTQAELAKSDLARAEKLLPMQAISQQEVDQLRAAARNGDANTRSAKAALDAVQLNLGFTRITAPISGRISRANITAGNLVSAGDPVLTTIVSMDKVYAYFDASESTYLKYAKGARDATRPSARENAVAVTMGLSNEEGFPHQGQMDFVDNRLDPATGSIQGRAVFDNKDGQLTPGLSARLKLAGGSGYNATIVPERAITTDQTRKLVMVLGEKNVVLPREVKPGALIDGMRVVTGVKPGENIVVDGLLRVIPGMPVTPQMLKVDAKGMPIFPPPQQGGAPGGGGGEGGGGEPAAAPASGAKK